CGRVCRRLSFKNPHHLFDGDFLFLRKYPKVCSIAGAPTAIGGHRFSFKNLHHLFDEDFLVFSGFSFFFLKTKVYHLFDSELGIIPFARKKSFLLSLSRVLIKDLAKSKSTA
ncbi:MAG: hypothetical protein RSD71_11350, partial [Flavobacterium sp.]|uniref:hypothetical protein n=1 Tax=Flavobacterium sp. TaxID=239 RepID=UPI002FCC4FC8